MPNPIQSARNLLQSYKNRTSNVVDPSYGVPLVKKEIQNKVLPFISKGLLPVQQFLNSPKSSSDLITSALNKITPNLPQGVYNALPKSVGGAIQGVRNFGVGAASFLPSAIAKYTVDPTLDIARVASSGFKNGPVLPQYNQLKSPLIKTAYQGLSKFQPSVKQPLGIKTGGKEVVANVAGSANPIMDILLAQGLLNQGKQVTLGMSKQALLKIAASGAVTGLAFGGLKGLLSGVQKAKDIKDLKKYALEIGKETGTTSLLFGALGFASPYVSHGLQKANQYIRGLPGETPPEIQGPNLRQNPALTEYQQRLKTLGVQNMPSEFQDLSPYEQVNTTIPQSELLKRRAIKTIESETPITLGGNTRAISNEDAALLAGKITPEEYAVLKGDTSGIQQGVVEGIGQRPWNQKALEDAANRKDWQEVNNILDQIPSGDPYKQSMEKLFRDKANALQMMGKPPPPLENLANEAGSAKSYDEFLKNIKTSGDYKDIIANPAETTGYNSLKDFYETAVGTKSPSADLLSQLREAELAGNQKKVQAITDRIRAESPNTAVVNEAIRQQQASDLVSGQSPNDLGLSVKARGKPHELPDFAQEMDAYNKQFNTPQDVQNLQQQHGIATEKANAQIPKLDTTQNTQDIASLESIADNGNMNPEIKSTIKGWIGDRQSLKVEAVLKRREFANLDSEGFGAISKIQSGDKYAPVRNYFDNKFQEIKDAGVPINYREDYLPQLWANSPEEVAKVFTGRSLGGKPSFTMDRVFDTYKQGIAAGLTPKYNTVGELAGWYEQSANKALADQNFFKSLVGQGLIMPKGKASSDWISLDGDKFPVRKVITDQGTYTGGWKAPPEVADAINNYLREPQGSGAEAIGKIANLSSTLKNLYLSSGIPKTGINFHGFNILASKTLADPNPVKGFVEGVNWMVHPELAKQALAQDLQTAPFAIKSGLTMTSEEMDFLRAPLEDQNLVQKAIEFQNKQFADPLFQGIIPATKLQYFNKIVKNLSETMSPEEAGPKAAEITNNFFGGLNYDQMFRDKLGQRIARSVILAPDWAESRLKTGAGIVQSLTTQITNPAFAPYRIFARNFIGSLVLANLANKGLTGHYMFQNDPGNTTNIQIGQTPEGQKRYVRPFGTAVDWFRIPFDVAASLWKGDSDSVARVFRNRMSPILSQAISQGFNINYRGKKVFNKYDPLGKQLLARAGEASSVVTPSYIANPVRYLTGSGDIRSKEELISSSLELPLRYVGGKDQSIINRLNQGKTSEEKSQIWNQLVQDKTITEDNVNTIKKMITYDQLGLSQSQKNLSFMTIDQRTQAIAKELKKAKTPQEKGAIWQKYVQSKFITKDVATKLKQLAQEGKL